VLSRARDNTHGRRGFVEVTENFKTECRHVLEVLRDVYRNDEIARAQGMSAAERLDWHQAESGKLMGDLEKWFKAQLDEKKTEPNSGLGKAIKYMQKHWHALTQFLRVAGAPLDNNICERALKKAILRRNYAQLSIMRSRGPLAAWTRRFVISRRHNQSLVRNSMSGLTRRAFVRRATGACRWSSASCFVFRSASRYWCVV
jgi:hypothetical protein